MKIPTTKLLRSAWPFAPRLRLKLAPADYVFIIQYYKNGGAERVINHYISALQKLSPDLKIAILTTDYDDNATWTAGVPTGVQFINLSPGAKNLARYLRRRLLSQVIKQLSPKTLHIVNCKVALDWLARRPHPTPYRTYLSLFNSDFSPSGRLRTYYKELTPAAPHLTRIFTDNAAVIKEATAATGLPKSLFRVHYQPLVAPIKNPRRLQKTGPLKILWASRISYQKRPDILKKVIQLLDPKTFSTSVYGSLDPGYSEHFFDGLTSVKYHKSYITFAALPTEDFDLFLYTSQADGMPNVLLEATAAGLPIIAPDVGGISEFINADTGFLIPNFTDAAAYATTLNGIAATRPDLRPLVTNAQKILKTRHSLSHFIDTVANDISI